MTLLGSSEHDYADVDVGVDDELSVETTADEVESAAHLVLGATQ
jgi:hypothetical protein